MTLFEPNIFLQTCNDRYFLICFCCINKKIYVYTHIHINPHFCSYNSTFIAVRMLTNIFVTEKLNYLLYISGIYIHRSESIEVHMENPPSPSWGRMVESTWCQLCLFRVLLEAYCPAKFRWFLWFFFVVCLLVLVKIKALQGFTLPACCEHLCLWPATLSNHCKWLGLHTTDSCLPPACHLPINIPGFIRNSYSFKRSN